MEKTDNKLHRYLIFELIDNTQVTLEELEIERLFESFKLPFPTIDKPVISMELRDCINRFGVVLVNRDDKDLGEVRYILPNQIKSVRFVIGKKELVTKGLKRLLKG